MFWPKLGEEIFVRGLPQWGWLFQPGGRQGKSPFPCDPCTWGFLSCSRPQTLYSSPGGTGMTAKGFLKLMLREPVRERKPHSGRHTCSSYQGGVEALVPSQWPWRTSAVGLYLWSLEVVTTALFSTPAAWSCASGAKFHPFPSTLSCI